jgi:hypothetical protein
MDQPSIDAIARIAETLGCRCDLASIERMTMAYKKRIDDLEQAMQPIAQEVHNVDFVYSRTRDRIGNQWILPDSVLAEYPRLMRERIRRE